MNKRQTNKLASYAAIEVALKANPEIANLPGLSGKLATLSAKLGEIKVLANTQTQPIQAGTARRDQLLEEMTGMALEIAGFVTSIARDKDLPGVARMVDVGPSFSRVRLAHRLVLARQVYEATQGLQSELASYGVTGEVLAAFQARITAADEGLTIPRSAIVGKKAATIKLAELFAEVDELLEDQIDRLVFPLRKTNVELYAAYRAARSVVDVPGVRSTPASKEPSEPAVSPVPSVEQKAAA